MHASLNKLNRVYHGETGIRALRERCQSSGLWGCTISRMAGAEKPCRLGLR